MRRSIQIKQPTKQKIVRNEAVAHFAPAHNVFKRALHGSKRRFEEVDQLRRSSSPQTGDTAEEPPNRQELLQVLLPAEEVQFLPSIVTMTNEKEREHLMRIVAKHTHNGIWTGAKINNRPVLGMATERGNYEAAQGIRKKPKNGKPILTFYASQVVLLRNGQWPQEDDEASHLCHKNDCVNPDHLIWERGDYNRRRLKCIWHKHCVCRLTPPCMFNVH